MKRILFISTIILLILLSEITTSTTLVTTSEEITQTSMIWYDNALYIAYNVYNLTSNTSTFIVKRVMGNLTTDLLKLRVPQQNVGYFSVIGNELYVEILTSNESYIYIFNGTSLVNYFSLKGKYLISSVSYYNHSIITFTNFTGYKRSRTIEINGKNITVTSPSSLIFTKQGIIIFSLLRLEPPIVFQPIGFTLFANYSISFYNWDGKLLWNKTYILGYPNFLHLSHFSNVSYAVVVNDSLYVLNVSRPIIPVSGYITQINLSNGEIISNYNLDVNGTINGLFTFDNKPVLITTSANFTYVYVISNGVKLAFSIPLQTEVIKKIKQEKVTINGVTKIENITVYETIPLDRIFYNNNYFLVENLSSDEVTIYTLQGLYHYLTKYNFTYLNPYYGFNVPDIAYYITDVLLGEYNNQTYFILLNSQGNVSKAVYLSNVTFPPKVTWIQSDNTLYILYIGREGLNATLNLEVISNDPSNIGSLTTMSSTQLQNNSNLQLAYVIVIIIVVLLAIALFLIKAKRRGH